MTRARREQAAGTGPKAARSPGAAISPVHAEADGASGEAPRPAMVAADGGAIAGAPVNREGAEASERDDADEGTDGGPDLPLAAGAAADLDAFGRDLPEPARAPEDRERDRELVQRAQAGERGAFRDLYERHHKRAFAVAYGVLKNKQDALDVVQESFVKVHRHLDGFQGSSSFYTWLYRIVMNLAIDQLRRRKTARPAVYDDTIDQESDRIDEAVLPRMADSNPRKAVIRRELMERVEEALATLPEYHRQVIVLREIEGLSYEEMAEALDVPKGTIMSRLFHARRKMQVALADYADGGDLDIEE